MKNYLILAFLFFYSYSYSQTNGIIEVNPKKEVYLFFKSQIVKGESLPNTGLFKFDKEKPTSIGIVTGEKNQDANLLVTTKDGLTYSFSLKYKKSLGKLNYFIPKSTATNYTKDMDEEVKSDKKEMTIDKSGLIVLSGVTKPTKKEVKEVVDEEKETIDDEALEMAKIEKEKLEQKIKEEKELAKKEAAALKKQEKQKAKEAKVLRDAKRKEEKALRDAKRKKEKALKSAARKKNAALKKEQRAIKKKELALKKEEKRLAKNKEVVEKPVIEDNKEVKIQGQNIVEPEVVEEEVVEVEPEKTIVTNQNEVEKQMAIPSSAIDVSLGMADGGFGLNLSYNKMLKKGYMKYGLNTAFSKIKSSLSQTDVSLGTYTFDLGYFYPLIHKTNVNMSIGGGGLLGYETINKGDIEINADNNFIYGAYLGTEFAYRFTDKMGVLLKYNQNFYLNSDVGSTAPYIGIGLRFYTNKKN